MCAVRLLRSGAAALGGQVEPSTTACGGTVSELLLACCVKLVPQLRTFARGVVDDSSHESLRALLREEGASFPTVNT
jgi:hypothetical protein